MTHDLIQLRHLSEHQEFKTTMKFQSDITINGKPYSKGTDIPWKIIYPFFLIHMLAFGASGFFMAYGAKDVDVVFLYLHGGFAIFVYTIFYLAFFGRDEVKWMFINTGLGILGVHAQIGWLLSLFGKNIANYPFYIHVIPFLYFMLYTFLIRHAVVDLMQCRENPVRRKTVEGAYIFISVAVYLFPYLFDLIR
jgi:hypothetical protein